LIRFWQNLGEILAKVVRLGLNHNLASSKISICDGYTGTILAKVLVRQFIIITLVFVVTLLRLWWRFRTVRTSESKLHANNKGLSIKDSAVRGRFVRCGPFSDKDGEGFFRCGHPHFWCGQLQIFRN